MISRIMQSERTLIVKAKILSQIRARMLFAYTVNNNAIRGSAILIMEEDDGISAVSQPGCNNNSTFTDV
jgi:hypothetical protein